MGWEQIMVRFFTFSQYHNKRPVVGSTFIRVNQLLKYWDGADLYKYGENPDVLIFQKVYCTQDYKFPIHFKGLKILDICDPDWLDGVAIKETVDAVDAVVVPTQALKDFISQLTDKPIRVIPDRFDMDLIPKKPKTHVKKARTVVWFGYKHNAEILRPALPLIRELGLNLKIISNDNPFLFQYADSVPQEKYEYIKYDEATIYKELQKADFAIMPQGFRPNDKYKSNNRMVKAILAGLPVAKDKDEVLSFMEPENRHKFIKDNYGRIKAEYDVRQSVEDYKELIDELNTV